MNQGIIIVIFIVVGMIFGMFIESKIHFKGINTQQCKRLLAELQDRISQMQEIDRSYEIDREIMDRFTKISERRRNRIDLENYFGIFDASIIQELALKHLETLESRLPKQKIGLTTEEAEEVLNSDFKRINDD